MKLSIIHGDTLKVMPTLESESIDLVITSPPYWGNNLFINNMVDNTSMEERGNDGRFLKGHAYNPATQFKKGQHWRPRKAHWSRDWLYTEYVLKQRSAIDIATEEGCTENAILFWLQKHGIKTRTVSEVRKIKHWGATGEDNPIWNKKGELSPNWKGGSTPERQAFYNSPEWRSVCQAVWKRDVGICRRCGIHRNEGVPMHIHHLITFINKKTRADANNLILLCKICHLWVHSNKNTKKEFIGVMT